MIYDVTTLGVRPRTTVPALGQLERWLQAAGSAGTLYACWYSELGKVNRILLLRGYASEAELTAERRNAVTAANPYGVSEYLTGFSTDSFLCCPIVDAPSTQSRGPLFEVRDYLMKPGGLTPLMDLWRPALPARLQLAPMFAALYAVTGSVPRLLHIYPWPSLEERTRVRNAARDVGWPPTAAPQHILAQEASIYLPAAFSPVH